jgi:RimJ/RimL family protein N-acetyltransferase
MSSIKTYRIETERLVIRCYQPSDAQLLWLSVNESIEHLRPWMPWINNEPEDVQAKLERIRKMRANFDSDIDYTFGIFDKTEQTLIGSTGLHNRVGKDALEIGYWINVNHVHKGYATEAVQALTKVGFDIENLARIEIHCDSRNTDSFNIPKKLGYQLEATLKGRFRDDNDIPRDKMIWTLFREDYSETNSKTIAIRAFDILGQEITM